MTSSYTNTDTFTLTNAKKLAAKVTSDMHQCRQFYERPSEDEILQFQQELIVLLAGKYVSKYEFGFKTNDDKRIVSWLYEVTTAGDIEGGPSGGLHAHANISKGKWFNFLTTNVNWSKLSEKDQTAVNAQHKVTRTTGEPPADGSGQWASDRTYVSGGVAITRKEFRPT
jgi:hypothetical protein